MGRDPFLSNEKLTLSKKKTCGVPAQARATWIKVGLLLPYAWWPVSLAVAPCGFVLEPG